MKTFPVAESSATPGLIELEFYDLIQPNSDEVLNGLVKIAAHSADCTMAAVSLVYEGKVKFKARYGFDTKEIERQSAFFDLVARSEEILVVPSTDLDERFPASVSACIDRSIRFCLGIPLVTKAGLVVGAMCVMDHSDKKIDDDLLDTLKTLAKSASARLELIKDKKGVRWQNELNQHLQSVTHTGYWDLDVQSGEVMWSDEVYRIYGVERDFERVKARAIEYYDDKDQIRLEQKLQEAIASQTQFSETFRFFDDSEKSKWVRVSCYPVVGESGQVCRLRGCIQDVTSIIEKQLFSNYAIEKVGLVTCEVEIPDGSSIDDLEFKWSDGMSSILALEVQDFHLGKTWLNYVHSRDIQYVLEAWNRFLAGQSSSLDLNFRLLDRSGAVKFVHFTGLPAHTNRTGKPTKALGMINDITTTIQTLQNERKATARLTELQSNMNRHFLVSKTDRNGEITFSNSIFNQTFGLASEEVLGTHYSDLFLWETSRTNEIQLWQDSQSGDVWSGEVEFRSPSGEAGWLKTFIYPEFDPFGAVLGYMWLGYNITERKEAEALIKLEEEKATFNSQLAAIGEMLAGIGHEISNPLTVLMGNMTLIQKEGLKPERKAKSLLAMERSIRRIQKITKGLHYLAQGSREDEFKVNDVRQILQISFDFCEESLRSQGIELRYKNEGSNSDLYCNDVKVSQMILNLINNAKDAIVDSGTENPWIEIKLIDSAGVCEIQVIDSGPGIEEGLQNKIMQSFFTTKPVGKGTGLGLSLVRRFAEEHGGSFHLNTKSPNTCFVIRIPKVDQNQAAA